MSSFLDQLEAAQQTPGATQPVHDLLVALCEMQLRQAERLDTLVERLNWTVTTLEKVVDSTLEKKWAAARIEERYLQERREEARRAALLAEERGLRIVPGGAA